MTGVVAHDLGVAFLQAGEDVSAAATDRTRRALERAGFRIEQAQPDGRTDGPALRVDLIAGHAPFRVQAEGEVLNVQLSSEAINEFELIDETERNAFVLPDAQRRMLTGLVRNLMPPSATVLVIVRLGVRLCALHLREGLACARRRCEAYGRPVFWAPDAPGSLDGLVPDEDIVRDRDRIPFGSLNAAIYFETVDNVYFGKNPYVVKLDAPGLRDRGCPLFALFMDHSEMRLRQIQIGQNGAFVTSYGDFAFVDQRSQPRLAAHHIGRIPLLTGKPLNRYAYGRLTMHTTEHGPIDSFGFRNGGDFQELAQRDDDTVVVAVYGGSGAFCWRCHHDDAFPAILERKLNAWSVENGKKKKFRILNFGQLGYTILEEMHTWIDFGNRIRPDIVISHSGFNDLFLAPLVDPALVDKFDLIYNFNFDEAPFKPGSGRIDPAKGRRIVEAYARRIQQFARLAVGAGGRFIFGRQPIWIDKQLSGDEQAAMAQWLGVFTKNQPLYQQTALNMGFLYRDLERVLGEQPGLFSELDADKIAVVDCHRQCAATDAETSLFLDVAHLTGAGNEIIAQAYFNALTAWH